MAAAAARGDWHLLAADFLPPLDHASVWTGTEALMFGYSIGSAPFGLRVRP